MKVALSKSIGKAFLTFKELEETLLDVECFMNNRPLAYLGEEFENRPVTPNVLIRGGPTICLQESEETLETKKTYPEECGTSNSVKINCGKDGLMNI